MWNVGSIAEKGHVTQSELLDSGAFSGSGCGVFANSKEVEVCIEA